MTNEFLNYVLELLEPSGGITSRKMFGGCLIRKGGLPIGLVAEGTLYFKVNDNNRPDFEAMGSTPFSYEARNKTIALSYWRVPLEILEDQDKLMDWTDKAYQASLKSKHKAKPKTGKGSA
jgi:DNA transformation protein